MSADFWAGYISGAVGIIIGNPLDVLKVKLQAGVSSSRSTASPAIPPPTGTPSVHILPTTQQPTPAATKTAASYLRPWITGTAAPVLGYGALNALLFVSYNRTEAALNHAFNPLSTSAAASTTGTNLYTTFLAGAVGGLATWVVSTPTELIKCRVQLASSSSPSPSSWSVAKRVLQTQGIKGLYFGGVVTALRDSIGYGFYFWSYELTSRWMAQTRQGDPQVASSSSAASVLLCGGLAGIVTWASIFPLDVIKTRVQTQVVGMPVVSAVTGVVNERAGLLSSNNQTSATSTPKVISKPLGAWEIARQTYNQGGIKPFFRGLGVCSVRAFVVNAVQWAVYEWIMTEMGVGRNRDANGDISSISSVGGEGRVL